MASFSLYLRACAFHWSITDERKCRSSQHSSFLSNFIATLFLMLNFNPVMGIIFTVPAAVISTVSTSLSEYVPLTRPSNMSDCSMSCSTTANQLHVRRTRYNIVSPSLPVNNARSHRSVSAHGSSSNNRPIARGNEVVTSSLNYKRTPHSEVHVRVSFRASLLSL